MRDRNINEFKSVGIENEDRCNIYISKICFET